MFLRFFLFLVYNLKTCLLFICGLDVCGCMCVLVHKFISLCLWSVQGWWLELDVIQEISLRTCLENSTEKMYHLWFLLVFVIKFLSQKIVKHFLQKKTGWTSFIASHLGFRQKSHTSSHGKELRKFPQKMLCVRKFLKF